MPFVTPGCPDQRLSTRLHWGVGRVLIDEAVRSRPRPERMTLSASANLVDDVSEAPCRRRCRGDTLCRRADRPWRGGHGPGGEGPGGWAQRSGTFEDFDLKRCDFEVLFHLEHMRLSFGDFRLTSSGIGLLGGDFLIEEIFGWGQYVHNS